MTEPTLTRRVEILEHKVQTLETLPARVEAVELQIVQLRDEMRGEFAALRQEFRAEIRGGDEQLRAESEPVTSSFVRKSEPAMKKRGGTCVSCTKR